MSTYVIGDIHGCYEQLSDLLNLINYKPGRDKLWLTGDVINGGPKPIETLDFIIKNQGDIKMVLGNHDITLLAEYHGCLKLTEKQRAGFLPIISHPNSLNYIHWLQKQPLIHYDPSLKALLVHAGIPPEWGVDEALKYSKEVSVILCSDAALEFYANMFGNNPNIWNDNLHGWDRIRYIVNALTRMRFCTASGELDLKTKGTIGSQPEGYKPWFTVNKMISKDIRVFFGHWAALNGQTNSTRFIGMDTGCMWGSKLSAYEMESHRIFSVPCELI